MRPMLLSLYIFHRVCTHSLTLSGPVYHILYKSNEQFRISSTHHLRNLTITYLRSDGPMARCRGACRQPGMCTRSIIIKYALGRRCPTARRSQSSRTARCSSRPRSTGPPPCPPFSLLACADGPLNSIARDVSIGRAV